MPAKYEITVDDDRVLIHGKLTIREAFDFLSFYEKEGFDQVMWGEENSALCLVKSKKEAVKIQDIHSMYAPRLVDPSKVIEPIDQYFKQRSDILEEENSRWIDENTHLKKRIFDLEELIKNFIPTPKPPKEDKRYSNPTEDVLMGNESCAEHMKKCSDSSDHEDYIKAYLKHVKCEHE